MKLGLHHGLHRLVRWPVLAVLAAAASSSAQMAGPCARLAAQAAPRDTAPPAAVALLQQRTDLRSQALADYLLAAAQAVGAEAARERLQDRARASTDPLLTVLALHMPCVRSGCRNVEASQWSRLEPDNLLAWLALPARAPADGRYLLDEIAAHVRHIRSYRQETDALLSGLPPTGLALRQPWGLLNPGPLAGFCREPREVLTAERCDAVADMLWTEGGALERLLALQLGEPALALLPQRRAVWAPRWRELEAATRSGGQAGSFLAPGRVARREQVCEALAQPRSGAPLTSGDWEQGRAVLQASGLWPWDLRPRRRAEAVEMPR